MNYLAFVTGDAEIRQMQRLVTAGTALLLILGIFWATTLDGFLGYIAVMLSAELPMVLWVRLRAPGVPILAAVAALFYVYYAVPIVRENFGTISSTPEDVLRAAATAALFLLSATGVWWIITREWIRRPRRETADIVSKSQLRQMIAMGLVVGTSLQLSVTVGWFTVFGTFFGVVRDVSVAVAGIACYMIGYGRARGLLRGQFLVFAIGGMTFMTALSWTSLLLVGGMQYVLAAILGYVIASKRIPWRLAIAIGALLFVLHAGKSEMRAEYWSQPSEANGATSVFEMPALFTQWFGNGVQNIVTGENEQDLFDRASLLYRLIFVEQLTPAYIPYLNGESYQYIGDYLIPRFLEPDKVASQASMLLLNLRYGVQTAQEAGSTAIGWGIVAEAYANFGYMGVILAGLLFGILVAFFTCCSAGAPPLAISNLMGVAALVTMTNVEADFSYMIVNLWHAVAAMVIFFVPMKFLSRRKMPEPVAQRADLPAE